MERGRGGEAKLSSLLKEKFILLDVATTAKKDVIHELVGFLARAAGMRDAKTVINLILKREALGSTGIGHGVAIPHVKSPKLRKFILGFGRSKRGIDFGSLDGETTYLFFILISPEKSTGDHLKALADISRLVRDKFIIECLKKAATKKEILEIVRRYDKR